MELSSALGMRLRGPGLGARRVLSVECPLSSAICRVLSVECCFAADQILLVDKVAQNSCSLSLSYNFYLQTRAILQFGARAARAQRAQRISFP